MARKRKIFRAICAEFLRTFGRTSHMANVLIACSSYSSQLDGIKNELNQGGVSQIKTILWGGDLMNTVSDCKRKLSDVLQTGQVCHRFICAIHLTQRAQFALSLDTRIAQDAERRRVRTLPILNRLMSPLMQFENPKAHHDGPPQPRAAGRSQIEQQLRPTPPQGDWSYPDYPNSDSMLRTRPLQRSQPYPPSSDGNLYRQTPVDVTGMNQIQQQPRQHQSSELGHRNGYPPYSTINVPGTSSVRQQSPPAEPWVGARQQHSHYGNPAVAIAAVGGGTSSRRVFPTAGPTGPALTLVNMVVVPGRAMAAGAPANWSPN